MVHGYAALHCGDGRQWEEVRAVASGVDAGNIGAGDAVDLNVAGLGGFHADVLQLEVLGIRDRADGHDDVGAGDFAAVLRGDQDVAILGAVDGFHAAVLFQFHAALAQHGLEDVGRIGVVMRQNTVAGGNHSDLHTQLCKGGDELGTGDAGTDDDEVLRQLSEVVDLLPGKDALAIRLSAGENARGGAGGYQDKICVNGFLVAVLVEYRGDLVAAKGIGFLILWEVAAAVNNAGA